MVVKIELDCFRVLFSQSSFGCPYVTLAMFPSGFFKRILNYCIRNCGWKWLHLKQLPQFHKNIYAHLRLFFSENVNVQKGDGNILWIYKPLKLLF